MTDQEHELQRAHASRAELVERMSRLILNDGTREVQKGVYLNRSPSRSECVPGLFRPAFCVIAQGSKEVMLGEDRYRYDPWHYLFGSVELPVASQINEASKERPYLGLRLNLEPALVTSVMIEAGISSSPTKVNVKAIDVTTPTTKVVGFYPLPEGRVVPRREDLKREYSWRHYDPDHQHNHSTDTGRPFQPKASFVYGGICGNPETYRPD